MRMHITFVLRNVTRNTRYSPYNNCWRSLRNNNNQHIPPTPTAISSTPINQCCQLYYFPTSVTFLSLSMFFLYTPYRTIRLSLIGIVRVSSGVALCCSVQFTWQRCFRINILVSSAGSGLHVHISNKTFRIL